LKVALGLKYVNVGNYEEICNKYEILSKMISSYIKTVKQDG
jgi:hypothetical protein